MVNLSTNVSITKRLRCSVTWRNLSGCLAQLITRGASMENCKKPLCETSFGHQFVVISIFLFVVVTVYMYIVALPSIYIFNKSPSWDMCCK